MVGKLDRYKPLESYQHKMEQGIGNTCTKSSIVEVKAKFFGQTVHVN